MKESIIGRLKFDHLKVNKLLDDIERTSTVSERKSKFANLKSLIVPMLRAEDEAIFNKLERIPEQQARQISQTCLHEHHDMRDFLQRLNLLNSYDKKWMKIFRNFHHLTQKHSAEEENILFPEIKEDFSKEELVEIGYDFEEAKTHPL